MSGLNDSCVFTVTLSSMLEVEQAVLSVHEADEPSEQMHEMDEVVLSPVRLPASFAAAFEIPLVSEAVAPFCAPYLAPALAAFETSMAA